MNVREELLAVVQKRYCENLYTQFNRIAFNHLIVTPLSNWKLITEFEYYFLAARLRKSRLEVELFQHKKGLGLHSSEWPFLQTCSSRRLRAISDARNDILRQ